MRFLLSSCPCSPLQEQSQLTAAAHMGGMKFPELAAMDESRRLVQTLAQNNDPKLKVQMPVDLYVIYIDLFG